MTQMEFTTDPDGKELLLKDGKFQVMMEWERPYMEACIDALEPHGDVLEIGFGCGYSATHIQKFPIKSHTIIEYHPVVMEKARAWAKDKPNVRLIEDTWQNALPSLGSFDTIFFDDYPLESESEVKELKKSKKLAVPLLNKGKKLLAKVEKKFSFLKEIKYSDADLEEFFAVVTKQKNAEPAHFLRFFFELQKRGQITPAQYTQLLERLIKEGLATETDLAAFQPPEKASTSRQTGDRFIDFLTLCLKSHMKEGARISCYLEDATSKYEDDKFVDHIITNPHLEYREKQIPITVSPHCKYYEGKEALVIAITKK